MKLFRFQKGYSPLLVSNPHSGTMIPPEIASQMTEAALVRRDTDWHLTRLYDIACIESAAMISANQSRYVVDLNRRLDDEPLYQGWLSTGIVPRVTFAGEPIYQDGKEPDEREIANRIEHFWKPYHDQLESELKRLIGVFGFAVLLDIHSIAPSVPLLFDGELPDFNFGTNNGASCGAAFQELIEEFAAELEDYSYAVNGRFIGGYITRHYGEIPDVHAVQLELKRSTYMEEETLHWEMDKGQQVGPVIENFVYRLMKWAQSHPGNVG